MQNVALTDTTVELSVDNFEKARDFYTKLGFIVAWEESPKPNEQNGYLVMKLNNSILCFFCGNEEVYQHLYFKNFPKNTKRGYGVEISIPVENIESYYKQISSKISKKHIYQPLEEKPWGKKDFRVVDPYGYFLRFNEPWNVLEYLPSGK
jgi:catechol 2,3-dioxygenase-like lactoylglutathione lyase family enzyme